MKLIKLFALLAILNTVPTALSQEDKPQKVYSIVKVPNTYEWYTSQYELWKKELSKNKKNPDAWINYLTAARMAKLTSPDDEKFTHWKEIETNSFEGFDKYIKGTYEYWIIKKWQAYLNWYDNQDPEEHKEIRDNVHQYCLNAYKIDPNRVEVYPNLLAYYVENGDQEKAKEIAKRWLDSGDITYSLLAYNYNMLASCFDNAILFTQGDNDTEPAWVLQNAMEYRTDVTVINIWIAQQSQEYRKMVFEKASVPMMSENPKDRHAVVHHVLQNSQDKSVFFTPGFAVNEYDSLVDNVYNVGAALLYSKEYVNNTSFIIDNFENHYLLDQLKSGIIHEEWPEKAKEFNLNYVSGLFHLLYHYSVTMERNKMDTTIEMIKNIAQESPYEEDILKGIEFYEDL